MLSASVRIAVSREPYASIFAAPQVSVQPVETLGALEGEHERYIS